MINDKINRRKFLTNTGILAGAAVITPSVVLGAKKIK